MTVAGAMLRDVVVRGEVSEVTVSRELDWEHGSASEVTL